jgi:hypothetical protein
MNFSIKKFFDPAFKVLGAIDPAELLEPVETPEETPETPETPAPEVPEVKPAEPEVKPEAKKEADKPETDTPVAEPTPKPEDWKTVLKKADRKEALKELGLDDFEIGLLDYRKQTGDLTPYLEAKSKDWDKVSDLDVMKYLLRKNYSEFPDEDFDLLTHKHILQKYLLDSPEDKIYDDREKRLAGIELKTDAARERARLKDEQAKFKAPDLQPDDSAEEQRAAQQKMYEDYQAAVKANPTTVKLLSEKKITIGEGDNAYNFKVDPDKLIDIAMNPNKFFDLFGESGKENWDDFYATLAFATNRKQYDKALIEFGKSQQVKEEVAEDNTNSGKPEPGKASPKKETIGQALANRGVPYVME